MIRGAIRAADGSCLLSGVERTNSVFDRMRGLLGRPALKHGEALLIDPCSSVHTIGMRFPVDVAFIDGDGVIRRIVAGLSPWRMAGCWRARMTLEMPAGSAARLGMRGGDVLRWEDGLSE